VLRRLGGVGLLPERPSDGWLGMSELKTPRRAAALGRLLGAGRVRRVEVQGLPYPLYMRSQDEDTLQAVLDGMPPARRAAFLAPLDNLIWDRALIEALFDFEYRWEVYKPAAERLYGYYVLPILYGDRFIARFEPERDEERGALLIKGWWWEEGIRVSEGMRAALVACVNRFRRYLGLEGLLIEHAAAEEASLDWLTEGADAAVVPGGT
jgi:hypothetical protein